MPTTHRARTDRWAAESTRDRIRRASGMLAEATEHLAEIEQSPSSETSDRQFLQARALVAAALHELRRLGPAPRA